LKGSDGGTFTVNQVVVNGFLTSQPLFRDEKG
jgi:hypothetical protein